MKPPCISAARAWPILIPIQIKTWRTTVNFQFSQNRKRNACMLINKQQPLLRTIPKSFKTKTVNLHSPGFKFLVPFQRIPYFFFPYILTHKSGKHPIPHPNITPGTNNKVTTGAHYSWVTIIKEMIINYRNSWLLTHSSFQHLRKCTENSMENIHADL